MAEAYLIDAVRTPVGRRGGEQAGEVRALRAGVGSVAPATRGSTAARSPSISLAQKWNLAKYSRLRFSCIATPPKI